MPRSTNRRPSNQQIAREALKLRRSRPNLFWALAALLVVVVIAAFLVQNLGGGVLSGGGEGDAGGDHAPVSSATPNADGLTHGQMYGDQFYSEGYSPDDTREALTDLSDLPIAPKSDAQYARKDQFGDFGYDFDNSGCSTREDIRIIDLDNVQQDGCKVLEGTLNYDRYTGARDVPWSRSKAGTLQVEHIVALEDVCISGACDQWGTGGELDQMYQESHKADDPDAEVDMDVRTRRLSIANDPLNLILVDGPENGSKGSKAADEWLVPANPAYRCEYVTRQVMVKHKYGLTVSQPEHDALEGELTSCVS